MSNHDVHYNFVSENRPKNALEKPNQSSFKRGALAPRRERMFMEDSKEEKKFLWWGAVGQLIMSLHVLYSYVSEYTYRYMYILHT